MDMEFSKNTPTTPEDVALADATRVTLQPTHADISPSIPITGSTEDARGFTFDSESTAEIANSIAAEHSHHSTAIIFAVATIFIFATMLSILYFSR